VFNRCIAYRDKKVVGVFVRFRAPLHPLFLDSLGCIDGSDPFFVVFLDEKEEIMM
jgi:hypothetical protein